MTINNRIEIDVGEIIQEAVERERQRIIEMLEELDNLLIENPSMQDEKSFNYGVKSAKKDLKQKLKSDEQGEDDGK